MYGSFGHRKAIDGTVTMRSRKGERGRHRGRALRRRPCVAGTASLYFISLSPPSRYNRHESPRAPSIGAKRTGRLDRRRGPEIQAFPRTGSGGSRDSRRRFHRCLVVDATWRREHWGGLEQIVHGHFGPHEPGGPRSSGRTIPRYQRGALGDDDGLRLAAATRLHGTVHVRPGNGHPATSKGRRRLHHRAQ